MDFDEAGLLDGLEGSAREQRAQLLTRLADDGYSLDELTRAVAEHRLALLPVDRVLGGVFGVARGALALLTLAVVVHLLVLSDSAWWHGTRSAYVLDAALQGLKPALPDKLAGFLP